VASVNLRLILGASFVDDSGSNLLERGVSEIFPWIPASENPAENLGMRLQPNQPPLRVKFGIDPTGAEIHLGHSIPIRKLRAFQDAGHIAVLIIGDFTAQIGDPTGKSEVRPQLTAEQVAANVKTYLDQIRPILDFDTPGRLEIHTNSTWLSQLDLGKITELLATMTVGQMLAKEGFAERFGKEQPIFLHEFLYPLMQGYDSVAVRADVELGGTDQKFNIAVGRDLQRHFNLPPQFGLLMPILLGTGGGQKMSKSLNNYVGLAEDPISMYSKLEKISDQLIPQYFELLTDVPLAQLPTDARDRQKLLALDILSQYHGREIALKTQQELAAMVIQGQTAEADLVPEFALKQITYPCKLNYLMKVSGLSPSTSEARRQIQGGAVKLEGERIEQEDYTVASAAELVGKVLQVGKKKFIRFMAS
jgi:tyrosyl-tRNA synthetase